MVLYGGCLDLSQRSFLTLTRNHQPCAELWQLDLATFRWGSSFDLHLLEGSCLTYSQEAA